LRQRPSPWASRRYWRFTSWLDSCSSYLWRLIYCNDVGCQPGLLRDCFAFAGGSCRLDGSPLPTHFLRRWRSACSHLAYGIGASAIRRVSDGTLLAGSFSPGTCSSTRCDDAHACECPASG